MTGFDAKIIGGNPAMGFRIVLSSNPGRIRFLKNGGRKKQPNEADPRRQADLPEDQQREFKRLQNR